MAQRAGVSKIPAWLVAKLYSGAAYMCCFDGGVTGARSFTKAGVEPASSASAATASRMGTGRGLTRPCSSSAMNNAEVTAAASAASPFPWRFQTWTTPLQDFFRRITATTTCDVCSHAPTTPPHWITLRRSASSLSSIDHNHGSILRATSPYPRATDLEQKTQRESWRSTAVTRARARMERAQGHTRCNRRAMGGC